MGLTVDKKLIGCRSQCTPDHDPCLGCGRDDKERLNWNIKGHYSDEEKRAIYDRFDEGKRNERD